MAHKYHAKKTTVDGIIFDSKAEARRYSELKLLERAGEISHLELQPRFILQEAFTKNGVRHRAITYSADFRYCDTLNGSQVVVEDVKGMRTQMYLLKKKLFECKYPGLTLKEI